MIRSALMLVLAAPLLAAQQATVARVVVTPAAPTVMVGDSLQLSAQALDAQGKPVAGARILFAAAGQSETGEVTPKGMLFGAAMGPAPIAVTAVVAGQRPVVLRVTAQVVPGPAARVELDPRPSRLAPGQSLHIDARVFSKTGDLRPDVVSWTSSAPGTVKVSGDGTVEAVRGGKATLTASAGSASSTVAIDVVSTAVASVMVTPASTQARAGDVVRFGATAKDAAGATIAGLTPTWSFAPGHGQLDADGAFVAYEPGIYRVTAMIGARTATAVVAVAPRDVRRKATIVGTTIRNKFGTSEVWIHPNGQVAYLGTALGGDRFYTLDISNPAKPVIVDSVVANTRHVNDIMTTADGKILVFTREGADNRKNGIVICSLEDPLHPKVISEFTDEVTGGVHSAFLFTQPKYGTHVYLTNDATGALHIIDLNDPKAPKEVGRWKTPRGDAGRYLHDIDVQDGLLYASYWNDGLVIIDIGNGLKGGSPSNPQFVSQYKYDLNALYKEVEIASGPGFIRGTHTAWRHKNYVFIADEVFALDALTALTQGKVGRAYGRLQVVDVSDILHPKSVAWYEPEYGGVHNIWVAGDTLYMGAYNAGFRAFDISGELRGDLRAQQREMVHVQPSDPAGWVPNATMTWGVVVKNGLAYVNDINVGLFVIRMEPKAGVVP